MKKYITFISDKNNLSEIIDPGSTDNLVSVSAVEKLSGRRTVT